MMLDTLVMIYAAGLVVSVLIFYYGSVRGRSNNPELWAVVFGAVWFITLPLMIAAAVRALYKERKH